MNKLKDTFILIALIVVMSSIGITSIDYFKSKNHVSQLDYSSLFVDNNSNLIIFTADTCQVCKELKKEFKSQGVTFLEKEITKSKTNFLEFEEFNFHVTPTIVTKSYAIHGFNHNVLLEKGILNEKY